MDENDDDLGQDIREIHGLLDSTEKSPRKVIMSDMMHSDEIKIEVDFVRELLKIQFPKWADLPLSPIAPAGTDNAMFKLGDALVVRLPRTERAAQNIEKECRWLPDLAASVPLPIPAPVAQGKPSAGYPLPWAICHLLAGENLSVSSLTNLHQAAIDMGQFVSALRRIDAAGGPANKRGLPLSTRDEETRSAIVQLEDIIDSSRATKLWESALALPQWGGPPTWLHGDLHSGNLLVKADRISAVIDFGSCGVGDPAADLMFAWTVLDTKSREVFRSVVKPDDASWARGRGWAFTMGIVAYPYYRRTNPVFAAVAKRALDEALADF